MGIKHASSLMRVPNYFMWPYLIQSRFQSDSSLSYFTFQSILRNFGPVLAFVKIGWTLTNNLKAQMGIKHASSLMIVPNYFMWPYLIQSRFQSDSSLSYFTFQSILRNFGPVLAFVKIGWTLTNNLKAQMGIKHASSLMIVPNYFMWPYLIQSRFQSDSSLSYFTYQSRLRNFGPFWHFSK